MREREREREKESKTNFITVNFPLKSVFRYDRQPLKTLLSPVFNSLTTRSSLLNHPRGFPLKMFYVIHLICDFVPKPPSYISSGPRASNGVNLQSKRKGRGVEMVDIIPQIRHVIILFRLSNGLIKATQWLIKHLREVFANYYCGGASGLD